MAAMVLLYSSTPPTHRVLLPRYSYPSVAPGQALLLELSLNTDIAVAAAATCLELLRQLLVNDDNSINMFSASFLDGSSVCFFSACLNS